MIVGRGDERLGRPGPPQRVGLEHRSSTRAAPAVARASRRARARRCARRPRTPSRRCSSLASTNLGVPVVEPVGRQGRRQRAAARPSPTASSSAASCSTPRSGRRPSTRASSPAKPISQYKVVDDDDAAAGRHPGQGRGYVHLRAQHPHSGDAARRAWSGRAGQGAYGTGATIASRRRELDQAHPRCADRAQGELPRRRRAEGVRRDPGGRAAEGDVEGEPRSCRARGNLWKQMRDQDSAGLARRRDHVERGQRRRRRSRSATKVVSRTYKYHYQGPCRDRAGLRVRERHAAARRSSFTSTPADARASHTDIANAARPGREPGAASTGTRARARSAAAAPSRRCRTRRPRSCRRPSASRCASSSCAGTRGLGQYGPAQLMDMRGAVDANGKIVAYDFTRCSDSRGRRST